MRAKSDGKGELVVLSDSKLPTRLVAIEMKRSKGGRVSDAQRYWLRTLNLAGVEAHVCRGCAEAIQFVTDCLKQAHSGAEGVK